MKERSTRHYSERKRSRCEAIASLERRKSIPARQHRRRTRRRTVALTAGLILLLALVGLRLALPHWVESYVNRKLDSLPEYAGRIGEVHVHLLRGAYSVDDVEIVKTEGDVPVPFLAAGRVDFSVEWGALAKGELVSEVWVKDARLNFVQGPTEASSQTDVDKSWIGMVDDLFPFQINRFEITNSQVWYHNFHTEPVINVYVSNMVAVATNLSNVRDRTGNLPAGVVARGDTIGGGLLKLAVRLDPVSRLPRFDADASVERMDLRALNPFLRAYANIDVEGGNLDVFVELAAANGKYTGYLKPLAENVDVLDLGDENEGFFAVVWEMIVGGLTALVTNPPEDQVASKIPISGTVDTSAEVDLWATIGNILRNAFVDALNESLDRTISFKSVGT